MLEYQLTIFMCSHCAQVYNLAHKCEEHEESHKTGSTATIVEKCETMGEVVANVAQSTDRNETADTVTYSNLELATEVLPSPPDNMEDADEFTESNQSLDNEVDLEPFSHMPEITIRLKGESCTPITVYDQVHTHISPPAPAPIDYSDEPIVDRKLTNVLTVDMEMEVKNTKQNRIIQQGRPTVACGEFEEMFDPDTLSQKDDPIVDLSELTTNNNEFSPPAPVGEDRPISEVSPMADSQGDVTDETMPFERDRFPCYICPRSFALKKDTMRHLRIVHNVDGDKEGMMQEKDYAKRVQKSKPFTYLCKMCNYRSKTVLHLKSHANVAHGQTLPATGRLDDVHDTANPHVRYVTIGNRCTPTQTGDMSLAYKCYACTKSFKRAAGLAKHRGTFMHKKMTI